MLTCHVTMPYQGVDRGDQGVGRGDSCAAAIVTYARHPVYCSVLGTPCIVAPYIRYREMTSEWIGFEKGGFCPHGWDFCVCCEL